MFFTGFPMLIVRRVSCASVIEAQSAAGVTPDPRDIAEVDSVEQGGRCGK